jgi:aryl-alcohol dehydrogenase-like predicted oxidoreductase
MQGHRAAFVGEMSEKQYAIIDAAAKVAAELGSTVPRVALAWVQGRPGVTSTIIGTRTLEHLEDNLKALDLNLTAEHIALLDAASKPVLNFPAEFNAIRSPNFAHAGATVNGVASVLMPNVPTGDERRW